jgi:porin
VDPPAFPPRLSPVTSLSRLVPLIVGLRVVLAGLLALAPDPAAASAPAEVGEAIGRQLLESPELLGDPGGLRSRLEGLGIDFQLFYNQFLTGKLPGGGANPDGVFGTSGSYDFFTLVDLEALTGWPSADFMFHVKGQYDRNINPDVGALSNPIDDADFDAPIYVDELWLQQAFLNDRLRFRVGFLEQQTMFDRNAYANTEDRQFLSTFLDNNPLVPLPNGLGAVVVAVPVPWLEIALGAGDADNVPRRAGFDTAFDDIEGFTGYFEFAFRSPWWERGLPGTYRLGLFVDGRELSDFQDGRLERGRLGGYLNFDQLVWREPGNDGQGLGLFLRWGRADPDANRLSDFWSVGFEYTGLVPWRAIDVLGFGVYQAIGSSVYRREVDPDFERETGIELYYRVAALPWLAITPDFQYIVDPGATGDAGDAVVLTLRFRMSF